MTIITNVFLFTFVFKNKQTKTHQQLSWQKKDHHSGFIQPSVGLQQSQLTG